MAYRKLNERSIRLFAATPEELEKKRPDLNAPYFRVPRAELEAALACTQGEGDDVILSLAIWKRKGQADKPDYFTAELTYPDDPDVQKHYLEKDDEWKKNHPKSVDDRERRKRYAMNQQAAKRIGVESVEQDDMPF